MRLTALTTSLIALCCSFAAAEFSQLTRVASDMSFPVYAVSAPGDPDRIFTIGVLGEINIVDTRTKTVLPDLFLDLTGDAINLGGEGGLLGMAFHPDYETNGKFYVYLTAENDVILGNGQPSPYSSVVREYTVSSNPNIANTTYREILSFVQPATTHNAGWIDFNPVTTPGEPQYLYIASGDGGGSGSSQVLDDNLRGKILRIDVDGDDFPSDPDRNYAIPPSNPLIGQATSEEILAWGLRNPWRNGFDSLTGDLWIGDVGQARREEVNLIPASSNGGQNFGWPRVEGSLNLIGVPEPGDTLPFYEYSHINHTNDPDFEGNAVIGGYVYRGPDADEYGQYIFGDNVADVIWSFDPADPYGTIRVRDDLMADIGSVRDIVSFGTDGHGNMYVSDYTGGVYRFEPGSLRGDYNDDGVVDSADYTVWRDNLGSAAGTLPNDPSGEVVGQAQYEAWVEHFGMSLTGAGVSVPEPASIVIVLTALLAARRR